jgi:uncharacterized protein YdaU (DUF1376 family)
LNYYPFHLGDYSAHTAHLEPMEDLAYRRMLDLYYRTEKPLPASVEEIARLIRMRDFQAAIRDVLNEFFEAGGDGWSHSRCDAEIAKMQDKQAKAKASAAASVKARSTNAQRTLNERSTEVELPTPTPTPVFKDLSVEDKSSTSSLGATKRPSVPCPYEAIVEAYHSALPMLPRVRVMDEKRKTAMRKRWAWVLSSSKADGTPRATNGDEALAWFAAFFDRAGHSGWLTGRTPGRGHEGWTADLDFLMTDRGLKAVVERTEVAA